MQSVNMGSWFVHEKVAICFSLAIMLSIHYRCVHSSRTSQLIVMATGMVSASLVKI